MPRKPGSDPIKAAIGRIGGHTTHARHDSRETTRKARETFRASFEAAADPDGRLDPAERARRADQLRKAHYARLNYLSVVARRHARS